MKIWISVSITILASVTAMRATETPLGATNELAFSTNAVRITPAFLTELSEELRTNKPAVHAVRWRANAAAANARTVRTWEDPMAKIGGMGARTEMRADDGDLIYGVEQKLPLFGKPKA